MRLDKFISYALGKTRSEARAIIKQGYIKVNEVIITKNDFYVDEYKDTIVYLGQTLEYKQFIYLMLNKPKGYLSATIDQKIPTVLDLVSEYRKHNLFMAGRLDLDSEGFLLLTNDGKFAHHLASPNHHCPKKYYVEVDGLFLEEDKISFEEGFKIYDGNKNPFTTKPAVLEIIDDNKAYITIREGKYHQVKKMCLKLNKVVIYLKRVKIGNVELDPKLKLGEYRLLTEKEVEHLKK